MLLLEASRSRARVVASDVGAIPVVLVYSARGILVQPGDIIGLSEVSRNVYDYKEAALGRSELAYQRLEASYSSHAMERQYHDLYAGLVRGRK